MERIKNSSIVTIFQHMTKSEKADARRKRYLEVLEREMAAETNDVNSNVKVKKEEEEEEEAAENVVDYTKPFEREESSEREETLDFDREYQGSSGRSSTKSRSSERSQDFTYKYSKRRRYDGEYQRQSSSRSYDDHSKMRSFSRSSDESQGSPCKSNYESSRYKHHHSRSENYKRSFSNNDDYRRYE
jgi:hypothetical protein